MLDLLYAQQNIEKYKFDYSGYLVIIDKIRTKDILESNDIKKMREQYVYLKEKYKKELSIIGVIEKKDENKLKAFRMNRKQIKEELEYVLERIPAIGFIILGIGKEIGIN